MSPHSSKAMTRHAWFIFSILTICYALVSFFRTSTSTLAVDIMREFAVGGGLMSVMSSAYFYPYGFMQIPAGILSDRWGSRNTIASFFVPALRVILYWFPPARHALGTGLILSLGTGGMLLATYPLMLLSQAVGWRGSMFAATAATVLVAGATWLWVRNRPEEAGYAPAWVSIAPRKHPAPPLRETMLRIVRSRTYWSVSTWFFCMYGSFYAMTGLWAGPYFIQGYGLDKGTAGGILFCMALGAVVGPSLVGVVVTWVRWSKGVLLLAASGVTILLAAPLLADHPVLPASLLPVWSLAFGIFCGGFGGIALTKVQEDFPPEIVGTATGMINIYSYIGTALLQLASGWIMEAQAPGQAAYGIGQYASMFILFMAMFVTAFSATLLGLGKSRGNATDVFSPMGEGETKSA